MRGLVHRHRQRGVAISCSQCRDSPIHVYSKHEVYMQMWHSLAVANSPSGRTAVQILQIATIDRFQTQHAASLLRRYPEFRYHLKKGGPAVNVQDPSHLRGQKMGGLGPNQIYPWRLSFLHSAKLRRLRRRPERAKPNFSGPPAFIPAHLQSASFVERSPRARCGLAVWSWLSMS